jgi:cyclophilin family peptidyl-prolyl cis-trans isomerase
MFASMQVGSVSADNRGKVLITQIPNGETIDASTINKTSCILYSAGPDKLLGTLDDVRERENVVFNSQFNRITISSKQKAGTGYRVRLSATRIRSLDGDVLDGEFNGANRRSGDGQAGGDYNIQTKNDKGNAPLVRMNTSHGTVVLQMNLTAAPATGAYFMGRANQGFYDNIMYTKSVQGNGAQIGAGSIQITQANEYEVTSLGEGKTPETTGLAHNRGTVAMERIPIDTTKEGNGFFFNLANNASNRSVFATVQSGIAALDAVNNLQTLNLAPEHQFVLVDTSKVPVTGPTTSAAFSPLDHAAFITRTGVLMRLSAV